MKKKNGELTVVNQNADIVVVNDNNAVSGYINNGDFNNNTHNLYNAVSGFLNEHPEELAKQIVIQKLVKNAGQDYEVSLINLDKEITGFISIQNSDLTKVRYRAYIQDFQNYCTEKKLNFLKITVKDIDEYLYFLKENKKYSPRYIRLKIASVSSFFEFLHLRHFEVIKINPFKKHKLPVIKDKYKKDLVTKEDYKVLCAELKRIKRYDILCIVELLYKYGWRIGIFRKMELYEDGSWESTSKRDELKGKITKAELKKIIDNGVFINGVYNSSVISISTVASKIRKITEQLFNDGKISCKFSAHDLRRSLMKRLVEKENGEGFLKVSKMFHKQVSTTYEYIKSFY